MARSRTGHTTTHIQRHIRVSNTRSARGLDGPTTGRRVTRNGARSGGQVTSSTGLCHYRWQAWPVTMVDRLSLGEIRDLRGAFSDGRPLNVPVGIAPSKPIAPRLASGPHTGLLAACAWAPDGSTEPRIGSRSCPPGRRRAEPLAVAAQAWPVCTWRVLRVPRQYIQTGLPGQAGKADGNVGLVRSPSCYSTVG
jgi:hypothetical protein